MRLIALSLFLVAQWIAAQERAVITVRDRTGAAVVTAELRRSAAGATSVHAADPQGNISFPAGAGCRATIFATGFESQSFACGEVPAVVVLKPAPRRELVVVTPTRSQIALADVPSTVTVLAGETISAGPNLAPDDALRQLPGFTLFRRSSSRVANPTSQGASLRGVGASGASRALVLHRGIPLNDPFGGWVYWSRIPRMDVASIEVFAGGASHLYGSDALSGVINIIPVERAGADFDISYGNQETPNVSARVARNFRLWEIGFSGELLSTEGYTLVRREQRGAIDVPAGGDHGVAVLSAAGDTNLGRLFLDAEYFRERRRNGTPLQFNRTELAAFSGGLDRLLLQGDLAFRVYGGPQSYRQTFTAIAADRSSEQLTRDQHVPAQQFGGSGQWNGPIGERQQLTLGVEGRLVRGWTNELAFVSGAPNRFLFAGGRQSRTGFYAHDRMRLSHLTLTLGARVDVWNNYDAGSRTETLSQSVVNDMGFPSRGSTVVSPTAGLVYRLNHDWSLAASYAEAFRAPTLNELYRAFRIGNIVTDANPNLDAERLRGGEASLRWSHGDSTARATFFWNDVRDPIVNRTLAITPTLVTRQRQNLGATRSRGVEAEFSHAVQHWSFTTRYQFVAPMVSSFSADPSLVGRDIPQTPRHQGSVQASFHAKRGWTLTLQGRGSSAQFEDDLNQIPLDGYFTVDGRLTRRLRRAELYVAAENIFDQRSVVGRVPVELLGPPVLFRIGLRFRAPR